MFRKLFIFSLIVLMVSCTFAQDGKNLRAGGYARIYSLGYNPYVVDIDNIKTNPAYLTEYSNVLWGDIGATGQSSSDGVGQFAGFSFRVNKQISVGALLTKKDFNTTSISKLDPYGIIGQVNQAGAQIVPLDNNLEFMGSFNLDNMILGLGIAYASSTNESKPASGSGDKNNASQFGINAGLILNLSKAMHFDASLSFFTPSATYEPASMPGSSKIDASQTFLMIDARFFAQLNSKLSIVPLVKFASVTGKVEAGGKSTDLPSLTEIGIGFGINYKVGDVLIAGGPSLGIESSTTPSTSSAPELKNSKLVFPNWNLGVEWYATEWLIGRLGYIAHTEKITSESAASTTTKNEFTYTGYSNADVTLGIGLRFGGFALDAVVNDDVLRQGLALIGGSTPTLAYISASYAF